jgi:hypothetical protein
MCSSGYALPPPTRLSDGIDFYSAGTLDDADVLTLVSVRFFPA